MKQRTDQGDLLDEVFSTEPDSEFSAKVLAETLRGVQRQQRIRRMRRYGVALVALIAVTLASSQLLRNGAKPELARRSPPANYQLVVTQPLTSAQITETRIFLPDQQLTTAAVDQIETTAGGFGEIGDDELISLAAPHVVALVRRGPHEAELVFVSSPSQNSSAQQN